MSRCLSNIEQVISLKRIITSAHSVDLYTLKFFTQNKITTI